MTPVDHAGIPLPIARNGITLVVGKAESGKTCLAFNFAVDALREESPVLYVDWTHALSPEVLAAHGIRAGDPNFTACEPLSQSEGLGVADRFLERHGHRALVVLDGVFHGPWFPQEDFPTSPTSNEVLFLAWSYFLARAAAKGRVRYTWWTETSTAASSAPIRIPNVEAA